MAQPVHHCYCNMLPCDEPLTSLSPGLNSSVNIVVLAWAGELDNLFDGVGWSFSCHMGSPPCMVRWSALCGQTNEFFHFRMTPDMDTQWSTGKCSEICWQMKSGESMYVCVRQCCCAQITFLGRIWGLWTTQAFLVSLVSHMNIGGCYWSVLMVGVTGGPTPCSLKNKKHATMSVDCVAVRPVGRAGPVVGAYYI